ncbi:unnamed protein product [Auanema sp. JU1783]|nr:unnamed protein product [Auanema sp. JU1783]
MVTEEEGVAFTDRQEGDEVSQFNLIPIEIKEMILKKAGEGITNFCDFKKFWSLSGVNKEFYLIFSSNYAQRHFIKFPCRIRLYPSDWGKILSGDDDDLTFSVGIFRLNPTSGCDEEKYVRLTDTDYWRNEFLSASDRMYCHEIPKYLRDHHFRVDFVTIEPSISTNNIISLVLELAKQASHKIGVFVSVMQKHMYPFLFYLPDAELSNMGLLYKYSSKKVKDELNDLHEAGKIDLVFDIEVFGVYF